jgi:hypothetical protein
MMCLLAAVLILWRCYYVKHHKHNTSQHTGEEEGDTHSHTQPVTLCEETGQVYYSTAQDAVREGSPLDYSYVRETLQSKPPLAGEYDVIHVREPASHSKLHPGEQKKVVGGTTANVYATIEDRMTKERGKPAVNMESPLQGEVETHVYAVVNRKAAKKGKRNEEAVESQSQASLLDVEMGGDRHSDTGSQSVNEDQVGMNDHSSSVPTDHVYAVLERDDTSASLKPGPAGHIYAVLEDRGKQEVPTMANKHNKL